MLKLRRGKLEMEVSTELQASAFLKSGYELVTDKATKKEEKKLDTEDKTDYKKSDIQRMSKDNLVELATKLGVEFDAETSGSVLKETIITKLGL